MKSRLKQQIFAISLLACPAISPANALQTHLLREQFQNPSDEAKPWTPCVSGHKASVNEICQASADPEFSIQE